MSSSSDTPSASASACFTPDPSDIMLSFRDVSLSSLHPAPTHILSHVDGFVMKGGMTALMGASGSGKSILMRALCGREKSLHLNGVVALDGKLVDPNQGELDAGYVDQEDMLIGELTVRETFRISAQLRRNVSDDIIERDVQTLIDGLGLSHVADNIIGTVLKRGLSGGQKRRVSCGVELAAQPRVIFLDEPTSGLDASSAFVVIKSIKKLARESQGKLCVMASIHQPNSRLLNLFDHLLLLGRGSSVYFGPTTSIVPYFKSLGFPCPQLTTPTDFVMHIIDHRFGIRNNETEEPKPITASAVVTKEEAGALDPNLQRVQNPWSPHTPQHHTQKQTQSNSQSTSNSSLGSNPSHSSNAQPVVTFHMNDEHKDEDAHPNTALAMAVNGHTIKANQAASESSLEERAYIYDFATMYKLSPLGQAQRSVMEASEQLRMDEIVYEEQRPAQYATSWWKQFTVLAKRNMMIAYKDVTLYWLQLVLNSFYGFMVGAEFYSLDKWLDIGPRLQDYANGIVWLIFVGTYLHVFKTYYLMTMKQRFHHEHANKACSASAWAMADFVVTAFWTFVIFVPGLLIGYAMIGFPNEAIGYAIFIFFFVALTAVSLIDLLCQFTETIPRAILLGQGTLVVLCAFAGGAFIRWQKLNWWHWLSEASLYTWSTRGLMIRVYKYIHYNCPTKYQITNAASLSCAYNGITYPCDHSMDMASNTCSVRGSTVMDYYKGVASTDDWYEAGILVLLLACFRLGTYIMLRYPFQVIKTKVMNFIRHSPLTTTVLAQESIISNLAARLQILETRISEVDEANPKANGTTVTGATCLKAQPLFRQLSTDKLFTPSSPQPSAATTSSVAIEMTPLQRGKPVTNARRIEDAPALTWKNLKLSLRTNGKVLVDDLEGQALPGRVLAIMGSSGAGKTTMLNALSGRAPYAKVTGAVELGTGRPLSKSDLCYVPQFDSLNPCYTVRQTMCITANLMSTQTKACQRRVGELLSILGLSSKSEYMVSDLNSSERKRLNIGCGLISNPSVLFLDEPTTGLDSEAALVVVEYMIRVARSTGVIMCMTIHQPSADIFNQLDDLLLLTMGKTAYFGPAGQAQYYFENQGFHIPSGTNPSDFYLDITAARNKEELTEALFPSPVTVGSTSETKAKVQVVINGQEVSKNDGADLPDWKQLYLSSSYRFSLDAAKRATGDVVHPERPSETTRLITLTKAKFVYFYQEKAIYVLRLVQMILLAIFIGTLFLRMGKTVDNITEFSGAIFFSIWCVLFAAIGATPVLVRDRITTENEYLNGNYELSTYSIATLLASLPYHFVTAVIYQAIVWFLVGFNDSFEPYVFSVFSCFSLLVLMEGISLILVEVLQNAMLSTTMTMIVLGMLFLFPGFFIQVPNMVRSVFWLSYIMPSKYSLDSQLYNVYHGQNYAFNDGSNGAISGTYIIEDLFNLQSRPKWGDWAIVIGYAIAIRFCHYFTLRFLYRKFSKGKLAEK